MTNYEMTEKLSEKMGVTMEDAKAALEACDWDMLDAALLLEKEQGEAKAAYSTRQARKPDGEDEGHRGRGVVRVLGGILRKVLTLGNRNRFEVRRKGQDALVLDMPVTILVVLMLFAFWVCVPLLVIGLFAGCRYSFSGAELGRESVNNAMDKAAEAVERVKEEVTREH